MPMLDAAMSRDLLGRLRDIMAGGGTPQSRLDKVVNLIATGMSADVCSCYVMRAGEVLELFATVGLEQAAVHLTRLRVGEGLVGEIAAHAQPMALADAWSHPQFVYRPETGEDFYRSLMGVPILRGGRVIGVLVVQTRDERSFSDWEVETLETVAMVIAELLASTRLVHQEELARVDGIGVLPVRLLGNPLNRGTGLGYAIPHNPEIRIGRLVAEDAAAEHDRLQEALASLQAKVDQLMRDQGGKEASDLHDVLETYRMFADDHGWITRIREAIDGGLTAEAAVQKVHEDNRARLSQVSDPILSERLLDLEDLANRLLTHLTGAHKRRDLPDDTILFCRTLGPTELLDYDRSKLRGLVLEEGSATMHAVIVAKALDIPVIAQVKSALTRIDPMDPLIVDGNQGQVFVRPSEDILDMFVASIKAANVRKATYAAQRDLLPETLDGQRVHLRMNAGLMLDLSGIDATDAEGIGLYRTELPFMTRTALPTVDDQIDLYQRIYAAVGDRPIYFRTLDVGGDKVLPYWNAVREDNPAMGWRSIRITLDRPAVMRHQLRALIRASAGREMFVMFPMITTVGEFDRARAMLDLEVARAQKAGADMPTGIKVGAVIEVPSLYWQLPELMRRVDFLSIGSNDLFQFTFAVDRGDPRMTGRYDTLSPPMLRVLRAISDQARAADVPLSVCGEMAGRPLEALALLGIGIRELSMSAPSLGPVKAIVRSCDTGEMGAFLSQALERSGDSIREQLRLFAQDRGVAL